ncbi:hypothetical protein ACTWPT_41745 [Nonomuraea sp. 3N208]|uniref:hypothetical protein n=1 Tax=Nonomuraea sp. 3N208 TaxID=3457421 RepID=UPI003FD2A2BF
MASLGLAGRSLVRPRRGERAVLRIAASMSGGIPVDLRDALTGLDPVNRGLATTAVAHSAGLPTLEGEST